MWSFVVGFGTGVYVGSYYNCKPYIKILEDWFKSNFPPINSSNNDENIENNN